MFKLLFSFKHFFTWQHYVTMIHAKSLQWWVVASHLGGFMAHGPQNAGLRGIFNWGMEPQSTQLNSGSARSVSRVKICQNGLYQGSPLDTGAKHIDVWHWQITFGFLHSGNWRSRWTNCFQAVNKQSRIEYENVWAMYFQTSALRSSSLPLSLSLSSGWRAEHLKQNFQHFQRLFEKRIKKGHQKCSKGPPFQFLTRSPLASGSQLLSYPLGSNASPCHNRNLLMKISKQDLL